MADISVYSGGVGDAGTATPQFIATASLPASAPLMLGAGGLLVANTGTEPIIGFAPLGGALPGQAFTPLGLDIVNVNLAAPYTAGTTYYMQPGGVISATPSTSYAGTAINSTTLVHVNEIAVDIAAANATPPPIDPAVIDEGPATAANKILTQNSFIAEPMIAGTIITATGAAGTVQFIAKPNGVHFTLSLSAMPLNDFTDVFANLPAAPSGYLSYQGVLADAGGRPAGTLVIFGGGMRLVRNLGLTGSVTSVGFAHYA